jgi:hypothetical protein
MMKHSYSTPLLPSIEKSAFTKKKKKEQKQNREKLAQTFQECLRKTDLAGMLSLTQVCTWSSLTLFIFILVKRINTFLYDH